MPCGYKNKCYVCTAMKTRKILITIIIVVTLVVTYLFRWNIVPLQKKKLKNINPTSYTFPVEIQAARETLLSGLAIKNQIENQNVFTFKSLSRPNYAENILLTVETAQDALFGEKVFQNQENQNDIFLHTFGEPMQSHSYFALGKPLEYRASFHIHFQSEQDVKTTISINTVDPSVIKGIGGIGPHGFFSKDIPVLPTTIEEYELLRYFGYLLGENNMPEVNYPE